MFDFFRDLFDRVFHGHEDEEATIYHWGEDEEEGWGEEIEGEEGEEFDEIADRLQYDQGGEYVETFFALEDVIDYVSGTPETVLTIFVTEEGYFEVYRFDTPGEE